MQITFDAPEGFPLVQPGDDLPALIVAAFADAPLADGDILMITSKIVSKAEGRYVDLNAVTPSARAREVAEQVDKDPRLVEVILSESEGISRMRQGVLIVRHKLGFTSANAGIDHSNAGGEENRVLLLPCDPDRSARDIRHAIFEAVRVRIGLIITDSHGRPFRLGTCGVAIGAAGLPALLDLRGRPDLNGRILRVTRVGLADELAAAAGLLTGQADEGRPVVRVRGLGHYVDWEDGRASDLVRPLERDLYGGPIIK